MDIKERKKLKLIIRELSQIRGRHTELVSVYVPAGYDLNKIIGHLSDEQGTAGNIKDARTRNNVIDSLERAIRALRLYKRNPANGLAVFSGNASENESKIDIKVWVVEPPEPIGQRIYRCDQTFKTDILQGMMEDKEGYGLIVIDRREATLGLLKGTSIKVLADFTSGVPGKFKAGGQCEMAGTLVQCSDGSIKKIEDLHNPLQVKSIDFTDNKIIDGAITDKWFVKKNKVYKIITKYPRNEIECSGDHLLFVNTPDGVAEKAADELQKGDQLLMPEMIKIDGKEQPLNSKQYYNSFIISKEGQEVLKNQRERFKLHQREVAKKAGTTQTTISSYEIGKLHADREQLRKVCEYIDLDFHEFIAKYTKPHLYRNIKLPEKVDKELAQFVGYFTGDGCVEKDRITFFEQRKEVAQAYKKLFEDYFKFKSSYKYRKSKNYHQIKFTSRPLVRLIMNEFPETKQTSGVEVPSKIMKSKDDTVAGFLKGLFDAEGYLTGKGVGIANINKTLIRQAQLLLLRFSIITSYQDYDNHSNPYSKKHIHKLQMSDKESLARFKKFIGFTSSEKTKKLDNIIKQKTEKSSVRQILSSGTIARKIIETQGLKYSTFGSASSFLQNKRRMGKPTFKSSILGQAGTGKLYEKLKKMYDCEIMPVEIERIEVRDEKTEMIDISVSTENFLSNGIVTHNSSQRLERLIDGMAKEFYKRVSDACNHQFLPIKTELKGILIGGPGHTKEDFLGELNEELRRKVIGVLDLTYTDESGLHDLVEKAQDLLAKETIIQEKKIMQRFFAELGKGTGKAAYGKDHVREALNAGAVEVVLLSEDLEEYDLEGIEDEAEAMKTNVQIISADTREGQQLKDMGGFAAILRYAYQQQNE